MSLVRWNKQQKDPMLDLFDWDHPWMGLSLFPFRGYHENEGQVLPMDISENEKEIRIKADLPGVKKEDIQVSLDGGLLTIRAERKAEKKVEEGQVHRLERFYGAFERRLSIGENIDKDQVNAAYENGVLELTLPKIKAAQAKRIDVK